MTTVYIGHDSRHPKATEAAIVSLRRTGFQGSIHLLDYAKLQAQGLFVRPQDARDGLYDLHSNAPCSTEFAISRFLVPIIGSGMCLFVDSDVIFHRNPEEIAPTGDKALWCVKHQDPAGDCYKMNGAVQTTYYRKNWSSVMLIDANHPANKRLSLRDVNERPGRDLHSFYWLHNSEIGQLPSGWNWLVGVQEKPDDLKISHFTLGGPFIPGMEAKWWDKMWTDGKGGI